MASRQRGFKQDTLNHLDAAHPSLTKFEYQLSLVARGDETPQPTRRGAEIAVRVRDAARREKGRALASQERLLTDGPPVFAFEELELSEETTQGDTGSMDGALLLHWSR